MNKHFTVFTNLPLEPRNLIWEHALPKPRVIAPEICGVCEFWRLYGVTKPGKQQLLTCQESWKIFKDSYERMTFEGREPFVVNADRLEDNKTPKTKHFMAYFDINRDTFVLHQYCVLNHCQCGIQIPILLRVKHLGVVFHNTPEICSAFFDQVNSMFPSMETFTLIWEHALGDYGSPLKLFDVEDGFKDCCLKVFGPNELIPKMSGLVPRISDPEARGRHIEEGEIGFVNYLTSFREPIERRLNGKRDGSKKIEVKMAVVAREANLDPDVFKSMLTNEVPIQFYSYLFIDEIYCYVGYRKGSIQTQIIPRMETRDSFEIESRERFF
jgi:hypothetical protein